MPLLLMGCFPVDFQEVKRPFRKKSVKRPIKVGKRPINEGKRPIKAKVLVGVSVGCLMGCFRAPPPWWKTAPLKKAQEVYQSQRASTCCDLRIASRRTRDARWPQIAESPVTGPLHSRVTLENGRFLLIFPNSGRLEPVENDLFERTSSSKRLPPANVLPSQLRFASQVTRRSRQKRPLQSRRMGTFCAVHDSSSSSCTIHDIPTRGFAEVGAWSSRFHESARNTKTDSHAPLLGGSFLMGLV